MSFEIDYNKYSLEISIDRGRVTIKLSLEDVCRIITALCQDEDWERAIKTIVNADPKTAVRKGTCPFPLRCKYWWEGCKEKYCDAECLTNGIPGRIS